MRGSIFSYSGGGPATADDGGVVSSNAQGVDAPAGNFRLTLTAGPGGYAGGGISFDHCVSASSFNALRFSAWIASGDITGCNFKSQLQTFEQRPTTQSPPGSCDPDAGSCYNFPTAPVTLGTSPTTFTIKFTDFTTSATHANPIPGELVGLQWQLESGAAPRPRRRHADRLQRRDPHRRHRLRDGTVTPQGWSSPPTGARPGLQAA